MLNSRHFGRLAAYGVLCLVAVASTSTYYWWTSGFRTLAIAASLAGCSSPPWYYHHRPVDGLDAYFRSEDFYLAQNPRRQSQDGRRRVTVMQVCNQPVKQSKHLNILLQWHRSYSEKHGYEYQLATKGEQRGVWAKISVLRDKVKEELSKAADMRLDWIFYSDVDTIIINESVPLQIFLPPMNESRPFLIAAADSNGLNAGVFFIKVDVRSLQFLEEVLAYEFSTISLKWFEQSAMTLVLKRRKLVQTGEYVLEPLRFFNSYAGRSAIESSSSSFQIHFPSPPAKRNRMLPLIEALENGSISLTERQEERRKALERDARNFWKIWQQAYHRG